MYRHYDLSSISQTVALNCIATDNYGMMWIGTSKGLYNFDGAYFHYQAMRDSNGVAVTALCCDNDLLLVGFSDGRIMSRSIKIWKKEVMEDTTFDVSITAICSDGNDTWLSTYGKGIFVKRNNHWKHIGVKDGLPSEEIYCMEESSDGVIWLGTDEGLTSLSLKTEAPIIKTYSSADGLVDPIVKAIEIDKSQTIWIGTYDAGVIQFFPSNETFKIFPVSNNWQYGPVTAIALQSDQRMMIGTQNSGVISLSLDNPYFPIVLNETNGYIDAKVSCIKLDQEGNFWVTSQNNGLDLFPGLFQWLPAQNKDMQTVLYDSDKRRLWYATLSGLYYQEMDVSLNTASKEILLNGKKSPVITSLFKDQSGNIWVSTLDEGVFVLPKGKTPAYNFKEKDGLANDNVLAISADKNYIWFATLGGASRCSISELDLRKPGFENFTEEKGLRSSYIYQIFTDSKGRTWFATDGEGLKYLSDGKFTTVDHIDTIRVKTVYSITEDVKGNIWFSTPTSGIFRYDGKSYRHFDEKDDITDLAITGIVADKNSDILMIEKDGLEVYESRTGQIRRYLDRSFFEGIEPNINAFFSDAVGNIWIATTKGILKYFPPDTTFSDQARLELTRVQVYLQPIDYSEENYFNHNQNHLTFDFQGFWNYNPSQIRYRYMLEGYDLDWIKTKDERVIYPNLPAGDYTFKIQATIHHNFNDVITRSYAFTIAPPFWRTWWFITLATLAAAAIVYGIIKWRELEIQRDAAIKEQTVEFQLENLKTQINPHFLFNSFNTLSTLIEEDQKLAVSYVENLADFYRYSLKYKDTDLISVHDEKELTDNYVFLLKQRHGESLKVCFNIKEEDMNYLIPPLTLQLLIENAVKHNIVSRDKPLTINIDSNGTELFVRNNLQRKHEPVNSTRLGLKNISSRFEILDGRAIDVEETSDHFLVTIHLLKNNLS
jgi:ligand-binding sensor domain-containing protein